MSVEFVFEDDSAVDVFVSVISSFDPDVMFQDRSSFEVFDVFILFRSNH